MVESRDSIIDELNNRIAVFEEDKVVLKAALRQLQKEIKEEAPKAQKLMDDLGKAEEGKNDMQLFSTLISGANNAHPVLLEIKRLKTDMNNIIDIHQDEILALQESLSTKQQAISETESNLTAIGTYVDRLEERLTSFAVTRRDMEEREKMCKQIEEAAIVTEKERNDLQEKVDEYSKQEAEVKKLLEELAAERTTLQKENRKLYTEREFRIAEQEQLQAKCASLENTTKTLRDELEAWQSQTDNLVPELEGARASIADLQSRLENMQGLEQDLEATKQRCAELETELSRAGEGLEAEKAEKERLSELVRNQTLTLAEYEKKTHELKTKESSIPPLPKNDSERNVPFRKLRKQLSKATGMHGLLTPPSRTETKDRPGNKTPAMKEGSQKFTPPPPRSGPPPLPREVS
jgi:chromosome segregation ATPase